MEQNPLAKYELRRAGGSARNTEGMFTNINGNAARDARRAAKRDARPMTYAEMQDQGMARPAPPDNLNLMFTGPSDYANLGDTQIDADTGPYGGGGSDYVPRQDRQTFLLRLARRRIFRWAVAAPGLALGCLDSLLLTLVCTTAFAVRRL